MDYAFITKILRISDPAGKFVISVPSTGSQKPNKLEECEAIALNGGDSRGLYEGDTVLAVEAPDTRRGPGKWSSPRSFVIIGRVDG